MLALGCTSLHFALNGKPNAAAVHDLGLASATLTLEATARGLFVHQMIGILPDKARELYRIPEGVQPLTGLAIGYAADPEYAAGEVPGARPRTPDAEAAGRVRLRRRVGIGLEPGRVGRRVARGARRLTRPTVLLEHGNTVVVAVHGAV